MDEPTKRPFNLLEMSDEELEIHHQQVTQVIKENQRKYLELMLLQSLDFKKWVQDNNIDIEYLKGVAEYVCSSELPAELTLNQDKFLCHVIASGSSSDKIKIQNIYGAKAFIRALQSPYSTI